MEEPSEIPFAATFPLPFRVLVLIGLGIVGWAANLHGLHALGVDGPLALDLRAPGHGLGTTPSSPLPLARERTPSQRLHPHPRTVYEPIYKLGATYGVWTLGAWLVFRVLTNGEPKLVDVFKYVPALAVLGVVIVLSCPWDICRKRERDLFILAMKRCLFATADEPIYFSDVIYADIFTSFAKVLGDVWLSICMLLPSGSLHALPAQDGWLTWVLPALMSLPYAVRFRQCLIEYNSPMNESRRPMYNALKYATAFPVIFLSAAQRVVVSDLKAHDAPAETVWYREHQLFRLWLLFAATNSLYSFWWDVTNDWGLDLLKPRNSLPKRQSIPRPLVLPSLHPKSASSTDSTSSTSSYAPNQSYPYGMRATLLYPLPVYPLLIFLNLVLRLTWSVKLSSHLHASAGEGSLVIFWLEVAEVLRRWMWVFVRVEWELVKKEMGVGGKARVPRWVDSGATSSQGTDDEYEMVFSAESEIGRRS